MAHALISFLGRVPKGENGYRKTSYRFPGEAGMARTAFIGWSLRERFDPDRLIIMGTAGSMWDYLIETVPLGAEGESDRLALQVASEAKKVEQALLDRIAPMLERQLNCQVRLIVIPYAQQLQEQTEVPRLMAEHVDENDRVSIDVTHGFRHLPMLALLSALYLQVVRNAAVAGIYYGSYDFDTGDALIHDLKGLLHIADWVNALRAYDKDGDYGIFAPLLERDSLPSREADHLRRAAFYERTFNVAEAGRSLRNFVPILDAGLPGIGRLFNKQLRERIAWHRRQDTYARQRDLARFYLQRGDYPRVAIFAYEAFITRLIDTDLGEQEHDYDDRDNARKAFMNSERGSSSLKRDFLQLEKLRNALAHGNPPKDKKVRNIIRDPERLPKELERLLKALLPLA